MAYSRRRPNEAQLLSGIMAASVGCLIGIPVVVTGLLMYDRLGRSGVGLIGFAFGSVPINFVVVKLRQARRGRLRTRSGTVFAVTCCASLAMTCGQLADQSWCHDAYLAALVIPALTFALASSLPWVVAGTALVVAETAVCLAAQHLTGTTWLACSIFFGSVDVLAVGMVAPALMRARDRLQSRETVTAIAELLSAAGSLEEGIDACLPLVPTVFPCTRVLVLAQSGSAPGAGTELLAAWPAEAEADAALDATGTAVGLPEPAGVSSGPVLTGTRCIIPMGHARGRELWMVVDGIRTGPTWPVFVRDAAVALSAALLLMTSRISYVEGLRQESRTDPLTRLANRRALEERLTLEVARASRTGSALAVAMVDLDHFKELNDRRGHAWGDEVLREVSAVLAGRLRQVDLAARYGGEEFCIVFPGTDLQGAQAVVEDLRRKVALTAGQERPTLSAGVAQWRAGESPELLVERADRALYRAKGAGRDRVEVDSEETPVVPRPSPW
jgi:diguanylate cyclase (GGDEF)-like protein